jgi:hypothetical protein
MIDDRYYICPVPDSIIFVRIGKLPEIGAAYFRLVIELSYGPFALPKFYVVTVNEVLGVLFGRGIVGTKKLYRSDKTAVRPNDVCSILGHRVFSYHRRFHHWNTANAIALCTREHISGQELPSRELWGLTLRGISLWPRDGFRQRIR